MSEPPSQPPGPDEPPLPPSWPSRPPTPGSAAASVPAPPAAARVDRATAPAQRPWRWIAAFAVAVATATAVGAWGAQTYETGAAWRDRALAEAVRADAAEARVGELLAERDELADLLARSEDDVADLERRLAELAGEKAGAEDSAALAADVADDLAALSQRGAEVGAALRSCVAETVELTNDVLATGGDDLDPVATNRRIEGINAGCAAAEEEYARLLEDLDAIAR